MYSTKRGRGAGKMGGVYVGFLSSITRSITEVSEQCLGLLQIFRIKPFGEPIVDRSEEFAGFGLFALLLPQPGQARGGPEFEGFGLLFPGNGYRLLKTDLGF